MPSEQALLAEYQAAHDEVDRLNRQLWTTGQILIPLSLAAFGFLLDVPKDSVLQDLVTTSFAAVASALMLWGWYGISKRWLAYQSIAQYRIIEIEQELDLWCLRYELYAANPAAYEGQIAALSNSESVRARLERIPQSIRPVGTSTRIVMRNLVLMLISAWVLLVMTKAAFAYSG
jgi:hypothetical protein